ncbi:MAG: hypothetical protein LBU48_04195 [Coriobacteriales bacterium]|jgi:hypothetical protein|nr:hypothetical protein [Coriobacteriales bacterium]
MTDETSIDPTAPTSASKQDAPGDAAQKIGIGELIEGEMSSEDALEKVVLYAFDEAREKLAQGGIFEPFTVIISGENLYIESHPGEDAVECFNSARKTVFQMENQADAYVFCYDGYVDLEDGTHDALVAETASKGDDAGEAYAQLYTEDDDGITFEDETLYSLGEAPTLFGAEEFTPEQLEVEE